MGICGLDGSMGGWVYVDWKGRWVGGYVMGKVFSCLGELVI